MHEFNVPSQDVQIISNLSNNDAAQINFITMAYGSVVKVTNNTIEADILDFKLLVLTTRYEIS